MGKGEKENKEKGKFNKSVESKETCERGRTRKEEMILL